MIRLLTVSEKITKIQQAFTDFYDNFGVLYALEVLAIFGMFLFVSKILRENDATKLMLMYWLMIIGGGALHVFEGALLPKPTYLLYLVIISGLMLIIFNVEVKKYFWDVHVTPEKPVEKTIGGTEVVSQAETERCITSIVKALQSMSKNNVGALIVFSRGSLPKQVMQSGTLLNAEISKQIIEGVFFPKAPLHDGAMVIQGHKIQAAGCLLPLTQKTNYPKEYGTRHRAAIGITEVANVISIVVSEETGIISIVKQGSVTRYADYDMLMDALKDYYWQEMPLTDKKSQRR
jgi:diadenylate cyclase